MNKMLNIEIKLELENKPNYEWSTADAAMQAEYALNTACTQLEREGFYVTYKMQNFKEI